MSQNFPFSRLARRGRWRDLRTADTSVTPSTNPQRYKERAMQFRSIQNRILVLAGVAMTTALVILILLNQYSGRQTQQLTIDSSRAALQQEAWQKVSANARAEAATITQLLQRGSPHPADGQRLRPPAGGQAAAGSPASHRPAQGPACPGAPALWRLRGLRAQRLRRPGRKLRRPERARQ